MTRRRPSYHIDANVTPSPAPSPLGQLFSQIPMPMVLTVLLGIGGFYYLTSYRLEKQESAVLQDRADREKIRDAFLANQLKTTEILGQISSRLTVSETKLEATTKAIDSSTLTLSRISEQLRSLDRPTGQSR